MTNQDSHHSSGQAEVYRPPPNGGGWHEGEGDQLSVIRLANMLLRHRWKLVVLPGLVAAVAVGAAVLARPSYTSSGSIMPQSSDGTGGQLAQLSGVAARLGINVPAGQAGQSSQFYANLLTSRRLLEEAVTSEYRHAVSRPNRGGVDTHGAGSGSSASAEDRRGGGGTEHSSATGSTLVELYGIDLSTRARSVAVAANRLEEAVSVSMNAETGVVDFSVTTPWPGVSQQVANRLIELVNTFNNRVRQSQAAAEAEFVSERLREARRELRTAEDSLATFLQQNVGWQQAPELRFRHNRLQRRVDLKQQVYTSLATRYEEARISEVKSTPVVTTVTRPQVPARFDSRHLLFKIVLGLLVGTIIALLWAFASQLMATVRKENAEEFREFVALKENATGEVRQIAQRIRRLLSPSSEAQRE